MFLPAVIRFNAADEGMKREKRLQRMAHAMGLASEDDVAPAIAEMCQRIGLPSGLAAMGVTSAIGERIVSGALADHCHRTNPRLASADDYHAMLEASM